MQNAELHRATLMVVQASNGYVMSVAELEVRTPEHLAFVQLELVELSFHPPVRQSRRNLEKWLELTS